MAPLVLHNVPDEELYTGKDGVTRPFAVVGVADERRSSRLRRQASTNTGSFGRARQRAGSVGPGGGRRQQQIKASTTTTAADEVFSGWKEAQKMISQPHHAEKQGGHHAGDRDGHLDAPGSGKVRKTSGGGGGGGGMDDGTASSQSQSQPTPQIHTKQNQPTEVILRGYHGPDFQYAAVHHYEQIAGRICEDYPRDPPVASRRYRSGLRDAAARAAATVASNGKAALTPAERQAVMRAASGQHWVKVTFESAAAADAALYASPQSILGYLVSAERYRGVPLPAASDVAVPDPDALVEYERAYHEHERVRQDPFSVSPSSQTVDSGTVTNDDGFGLTRTGTAASTTSSSATLSGMGISGSSTRRRMAQTPGGVGTWQSLDAGEEDGKDSKDAKLPAAPADDNTYCRRIPTARRATLKAPEQALLPRESAMKSLFKQVPLLHRLTGTIIGNQVPRKEDGLFDWDKASLYWKLIWWLDSVFGLFGGEILDANKDE